MEFLTMFSVGVNCRSHTKHTENNKIDGILVRCSCLDSALWTLSNQRAILLPTEKQSKQQRVGSTPNLDSLSKEGKWLRARRWVDGVVPRQPRSGKADGKQQCRLSPELQIHGSSNEVSSRKGSHLNRSSCDTGTTTTSNTTTTDSYLLPKLIRLGMEGGKRTMLS
ncbi:hypothetical protein VPH35_062352 [Triticum aestivum]